MVRKLDTREKILGYAKKHPEAIDPAIRRLLGGIFSFLHQMREDCFRRLRLGTPEERKRILADIAKGRESFSDPKPDMKVIQLGYWLEAFDKAPRIAEARELRAHEKLPTAWERLLGEDGL